MDVVSVGETARLLGCSEGTVRNWDRAGILKSFRLRSGQRLFERAHVLEVARDRGRA